jgi:hypothetical protein
VRPNIGRDFWQMEWDNRKKIVIHALSIAVGQIEFQCTQRATVGAADLYMYMQDFQFGFQFTFR